MPANSAKASNKSIRDLIFGFPSRFSPYGRNVEKAIGHLLSGERHAAPLI
jgi:hypothetical protein